MRKSLTLVGVLTLLASPALADHGNPWATADDVVLSQFHDANQARSVGTPGEDEMRGALVRRARGKLESPSQSRGHGQRQGRGKGRH